MFRVPRFLKHLPKDEEERDHDEKAEDDNEHNEQGDIPGFDRDEFKINSEVIQLKKLAYRNHKLDIRVMVTTTDQNVLAEELRALALGFKRAVRDADVDADEFFAEVHQIKFTLYDKHKNTVFAIFLDLQWLRELLDGTMTDEEFANRICEYDNYSKRGRKGNDKRKPDRDGDNGGEGSPDNGGFSGVEDND